MKKIVISPSDCPVVFSLAACTPAAKTQEQPKRVVYLINGALGDNRVLRLRQGWHRQHCQTVRCGNPHH